MTKEIFSQNLDNSLGLLLELTRQNCFNELSQSFKFLVQPSGTDFHDGLDEFEKKNLINLNRYADKRLTKDQVIDLLVHDNKVPLWINTTVYQSKKDLTIIHLFCSRRLRTDNELFHQIVIYPPFSTLVPFPPDPLRKDINGKFDINWKKQLDDRQNSWSIFAKFKRFFRSSR
jgi:hypothetical protein